MDEADLELRQNLLEQFRKWKRRRRRKWNVRQQFFSHRLCGLPLISCALLSCQIVVTERAKREMAAQDDMDGGGGGKGARR